jgi:flagella basal body P-ring formation protein FlgA
LRLAQCAAPLESFLPNGANLGVRTTVAVRCTQGADWTLYVPVNIEVEATVLTLAHDAAKDSVLKADDVKVSVRRLPGMRANYLSEIEQLKGLRLARSLVSGTVLAADMLTQALVIRRGQEVTLLASVGGIEVRTRGTALMDGAANSRIQVRNGATSRVVEGVVDSDSVVRVVL